MARKKRAQRVDHGLHDVVVDRRQPERYWHGSEGLWNPSSEAYVGSLGVICTFTSAPVLSKAG
jgi:hypothetical protein